MAEQIVFDCIEPSHGLFKNIAGERFGRLTARYIVRNSSQGYVWACSCECGAECIVPRKRLKNGMTRSCGCLPKGGKVRHGHSANRTGTKVYRAWMGMKDRCYNPNATKYRSYGGRGITVCERWLGSFEDFFADIGEPPSPSHSIDRIDVNGNYEPSNCRWATPTQQARNATTSWSNRFPEHFAGESIASRSKAIGLNPAAIAHRMNRNWCFQCAISLPRFSRCQHRGLDHAGVESAHTATPNTTSAIAP